MQRYRVTTILALLLTATALGDETKWKLAWKDEFNRKTLGDDWEEHETASIVDGWLYLPDLAMLTCTRSFAPDVMVVFGGLVSSGNHPNLLETGTGFLNVGHHDLDPPGPQEARNGPYGFRVHQTRVEEGRREHVACDPGEAVEEQNPIGHRTSSKE